MAEHYNAAQRALRSGDQTTAAAEYKAFLAEAIHRAANARARAGELNRAAQSLEEATSFSPNDAGLHLDYASMLFDQGKFNKAETPAQSVVTADPKNGRAQMLLGKVLFEEKDYAAARSHLESAAELGQFRQVWRMLALTYMRLRQVDRARVVLERMIGELGNTSQNRVAAATVYYYGDYPDNAAEELRKVIAQHPTAPDAHYYLGLAYLARNEEADYGKAVPAFRAELALNPNDFRSRYMLGYIGLQERHFSEAEPELKRAHSLNPTDMGTQLLLGQLYSETDRAQLAEQALRQLIASWGDSAPDFRLVRAHYILGRVLRESGSIEAGDAEIKVAEQLRRELRTSSSEAPESRLKSIANTESATAGAAPDKSPTVANSAEKTQALAFVAQISPLIGEAYYNLGAIAAHHNDPALAGQYVQRASEWDPSLAKLQH